MIASERPLPPRPDATTHPHPAIPAYPSRPPRPCTTLPLPTLRPSLRHPAALLGLLAALAAPACGAPAAPQHGGPHAGAPAGPSTLRVLPDRVDGRALLANDGNLAAAAGAGQLQIVGADMIAEGERVGGFIEIPQAECALAMARATPTIGDIDLFAYDDEGSIFSADDAADAKATLLVCPPHPRRLYLVARVVSGAGAVSVGVQSVPAAAADPVAKAVGARGRPGEEAGALEAWPGLDAKIQAHRAAIGGRWDNVRRLALPVGARAATRFSLSVEEDRCTDVLVVPSDEVGSLEVVAEDAAGRIVARSRERGDERSLVLCAAAAAELSVALRARASQGLVAVVVGRSPAFAAPEISGAVPVAHVTETRELTEVRAAHDRSMEGRGFGAPKSSTGTAKAGSRTTLPLDLPAGCARVDVLAGRPLGEFLAELWTDRGELLLTERAGPAATLYSCGAGGQGRLDVEALARPGPFAVVVRKDPAAPPALVAHPLAASRLLGRLLRGGVTAGSSGSAGSAAGAQAVALEDTRLTSLPLPIPAGGCVEVIAALDRGGSGLDLRLLDTSSGESSVVRARHVVSDRRCAGASAVPGSAELRLGSGKGEALVLIRPVSGP